MSRYLSNILMTFMLGFRAGLPVSAHDGKTHDAGPDTWKRFTTRCGFF